MKVVLKSVRLSPKKLNLVAELIRNQDAQKALEMLALTPKKGAKTLHKALKSAVANATNNFNQSANDLYVKEVVVSKAQTFKRWVPISRGRVHPILKRNSHLKLIVAVKEESPKPETKKETAGKETKPTSKPDTKAPESKTKVKKEEPAKKAPKS